MGRYVGDLVSCCKCGFLGFDYGGWMDLLIVCGFNFCLVFMLKLLFFGLVFKFGIIYLYE